MLLVAVLTVTGHSERKLTDMVVLSDDYLTVPLDRMASITPVVAMVGGRVVFSRVVRSFADARHVGCYRRWPRRAACS